MATKSKSKIKTNKQKSTNKRAAVRKQISALAAAHGYKVANNGELVADLPTGLERPRPGSYWAPEVCADRVFLATRLALDISKEVKRAEDAHVHGARLAIKIEAYSHAHGNESIRAEIRKQWTAACKKFGAKIKPAPAGRPDYLRSDYFTITFKSGREIVFYPE